jgi:hypothetical protein
MRRKVLRLPATAASARVRMLFMTVDQISIELFNESRSCREDSRKSLSECVTHEVERVRVDEGREEEGTVEATAIISLSLALASR